MLDAAPLRREARTIDADAGDSRTALDRREELIQALYEGYPGWKDHRERAEGYVPRIYASINRIVGIGKQHRVLEIGFGNGEYLDFCKKQGIKTTGIEIIAEYINNASNRGHEAILGDFRSISMANRSFDFIVAFDIFEHLYEWTILEYLEKAVELLVPGGSLVMKFPNGGSPFGLRYQRGDATHKSALTASKMWQIGRLAGFQQVREFGCPRAYLGRFNGLKSRICHRLFKVLEFSLSHMAFNRPMVMEPNLIVVLVK